MVGEATRRIFLQVHPNHSEQRCDGQGDQQRGQAVVDELDLGDEEDDEGGEK